MMPSLNQIKIPPAASYLLGAYIVLMVVQDLPLQLTLGTIARSPYILLSPIVFLYCTLISSKIIVSKFIYQFLTYYVYSIFISISIVLYFVYVLQIGSTIVYGENLWLKLIKSASYNLIIILTLYNFIFIFRAVSLKLILNILGALVVFQLVVGYGQLIVPEVFDRLLSPELHATERLSLLNTEPSQAYPQFLISLLCYLVVSYFVYNKVFVRDVMLVIISTLLLLLIQSKGGVILTVLCLLAVVLFTKQRLSTKLRVLAIVVVFSIPVVWVIISVIIPNLQKDIEEFTSFSTRLITIVSGLYSLYLYPLGQGYSTFYITYPPLLDECISYILNISPVPLSTNELYYMINTGRSLSVKSGLLNEALYSGWAILIFYFYFFKTAYQKLNRLSITIGVKRMFQYVFLFVIVNYLFVSSIETSYIAFLPFALLDCLCHKLKSDNFILNT